MDGLQRIEQLRAHEYVAEALRRQIFLSIVSAGESLPPERRLMEVFGVGRETVQQAIKLLEGEGLVERRRGRLGGTYVLPRRRGDSSARLLGELRRDAPAIRQALDFREDLEPAIAARCADCAPAERRAELRALADAVAGAEDDAAFERADTELHLRIAAATGNRFYVRAVEEIRLTLYVALAALPESDLWHQRSLGEHDALVSAIEQGNAELAEAAMRVHLAHTGQSVRAMLDAL